MNNIKLDFKYKRKNEDSNWYEMDLYIFEENLCRTIEEALEEFDIQVLIKGEWYNLIS